MKCPGFSSRVAKTKPKLTIIISCKGMSLTLSHVSVDLLKQKQNLLIVRMECQRCHFSFCLSFVISTGTFSAMGSIEFLFFTIISLISFLIFCPLCTDVPFWNMIQTWLVIFFYNSIEVKGRDKKCYNSFRFMCNTKQCSAAVIHMRPYLFQFGKQFVKVGSFNLRLKKLKNNKLWVFPLHALKL